MQVKRTEAAEKPKGMIERNQSLDNLNSDTLESKVDATIKHSAENGLKTSGNIVNEEIDEKYKYVAAQRAKLINEENVASKPKQAGYDEYYKRQLEDSSEESEPKQEFSAHKSEQSTIHTKSSNSASNTVREQFLHNKQINSSDDKSRTRKNKNADFTEYEVKGDDKSVALYQRDLDKKTRKLLSKGEVEEKPKSRIKTGQDKSVSDRADVLRSDHDSVKKFKYYRSSNGQIQSKVEYNRQLLKKVEPKGLNKLPYHDINNQRRIKSINREAVSAFEKDNDTLREQFVHNKQIRSSDEKIKSRKDKKADITKYEIKGENKSFNLYQRDLDRKTRKLLGKGEVEEKPKSRIKTGQEKSVSDRADVLKSDHDSVKKFKYYRSSNGQIQSKVEYNRQLLKKVEPKGINKLSIHELSNQRRIKSINREAVSAFEKDNESWEQYRNDPNARNAKLYRKAHNNYIGVLKNKYSAEELASGNFIEFGNKKVRVLTKVSFEGNIDDLKKTIKLDKRSYRKLRSHLRFKKLSKASASVLGKLISLSAVSLPKATLRSGLNYINTKAKSVNTEDTSDTGIEASKYIYKTASEGKHLATSVKSGIQTSAKAAKATYKTVREIPGMVKNIPHTARKIATSVRTAPHTAKNAVNKTAKKAAQNARKAAKQAQKAAQKTVETTKKAVQAAEKVAEVTFKAMAKAATFFVTHLPIILIISLVLIVLFLIVALASGMITSVSNTTVAGVSYAFPHEEVTPLNVYEIIFGEDGYQKTLEKGLEDIKDNLIDRANSFLTESDDFYDAITDNRSGYWIAYAGGEPTVREILDTVEIDYQ